MYKKKFSFTNSQTILFIVVLSSLCACVLSILASVLKQPKEEAKVVDRSKQLLISAGILTHNGYFSEEKNGEYRLVKYDMKTQTFTHTETASSATNDEVLDVMASRVRPMLVNRDGMLIDPESVRITFDKYINEHKKIGFSNSPYLPIYEIYTDHMDKKQKPSCYVIPISGFGLWDYIFGFIAIKTDGKTVQGISWYEQKETPGLGANIAESDWQAQFPGKVIFIPEQDGEINFERAPIGITVVRGKVKEVIGDSPKARASVDGMAGATLTGNGVTKAYKETLELYRPFFIQLAKNGPEKDK